MIDKIKSIIENSYKKGYKSLNEIEVYEIFKIFNLDVPYYIVKKISEIDFDRYSKDIFDNIKSENVVIKIVSSTNLHKTDCGGVKIIKKDINEIKKALTELTKIKNGEYISAIEFIKHSPFSIGEEILLGAKSDDAYGPIIVLGPGGTHTESFVSSLKEEKTPDFITVSDIDDMKIESFVENSWILNYCFGKVRGLKKLSDKSEIIKWIRAVAYIMSNFSDEKENEYTIEELEINPLALSNGKFYSLDGVLRFRKSKNKKRDIPSHQAIKSILMPQTIAVVGVSEKKMNMARIILNNTIKAGFSKENLFIIKEGVNEIDGVKAYKSVYDLPSVVDMYVVSVPVENLIEVMKDAVESKKVNGVVLITGGVGEKSGSESIAKELISLIQKGRALNNSFALNGGNCMGIVLNDSKVNTFFIPEYKMKYPLGNNPYMSKTAFVSQSGAFVIATLTKIPHIIPHYTITVGNQQDITVVDYLDYMITTDVKVILAYIEGFKYKDGLRLKSIIERAKELGKIVVLYKAGRTSIGQEAVMGHTASIAGDYLVSQKLLSKSGAIVCDNFDEFCDMAWLTTYYSKYTIKSNSVFIMSNAGFETTGMADNIKNLEVKEPDITVKSKVDEILKKYRLDLIVDFKNPMDTTPMASDDAIYEIVQEVLKEEYFSSVLLSMVPLTPNLNTLPKSDNIPDDLEKSFIKSISKLMDEYKKPVLFCVASGSLYDSYVDYAAQNGFVVFRNSDRMVRIFEKYISSL